MKFYAILVITIFFYVNLYSQCSYEVNRNGFEYEVNIDIQINDIIYTQAGSTCNANIEIAYDVDINVISSPSWWNQELWVLQGNLDCAEGSGSSFFDLPNGGGSGTVISETFSFNNTDCNDVTIDCPITISIQGPELNSTSNCGSLENLIVPVVLNDFHYESKNDHTQLKWSTSSEVNFSHFNLEKSEDGRTWESETMVKGEGENGSSYEYTIIDETSSYYARLTMVDIDGSVSTSNVLFIENTLVENEFLISPNPSDGLIKISNKENISLVMIYDQYGKMVFQKEGGSDYLELYDLPAGHYYLKLISSNNTIRLKKFVLM